MSKSIVNGENPPKIRLNYRDEPPKSQICRSTRRNQLRTIEEIPSRYRYIFDGYESFNAVQSKCFDDVYNSSRHIVLSAPTGSGKTVIFELAMIRALEESNALSNLKIIYVAPIKALCKERLLDWSQKFHSIGVRCKEATGDQELTDIKELDGFQIILTTPEKWDSLTRKWKDNRNFVSAIKLFLVDEIHLLNEHKRGPTLEAVVSRMKTISGMAGAPIRFVAVSATIPNIEDLALWLGNGSMENVRYFAMPDEMRPVKLRKIVLGIPCDANCTYFRFDMNLNYQLVDIINQHSSGKPTLIFCSTRKGVEIAAEVLAKDIFIGFTDDQQRAVTEVTTHIHDKKLQALVSKGIAFHHAGVSSNDRSIIEMSFRDGKIPILLSTSTLAMGINLPAHLVIIKSTQAYNPVGGNEELTESAILQMIGRAGRPQFDTTGVAVIITQESKKTKYEKLVCGTLPVESHLHKTLAEHLNSEIVLQTINELDVAMQWIRSTFLYVRAHKNPLYYGFKEGLCKNELEKKLEEMCLNAIDDLEQNKLIVKDTKITATEYGRLMARYYVCFGTMKKFRRLKGDEGFDGILRAITESEEFSDYKLRANEKRVLNDLNRSSKSKIECIRFPIKGKIKTVSEKISCIIQAVLGNLNIADQSLQQEATRILALADRLSKCLSEFLVLAEKDAKSGFFDAIHKALVINKSVEVRLWENSPYVSKQFNKIGAQLSSTLVKAGVNSIKALCCTDPREMEKILKKSPPFGNELTEQARQYPQYEVELKYHKETERVEVFVKQVNEIAKKNWRGKVVLVIGNNLNSLVMFRDEIRFQNIANEEIYTTSFEIDETVETISCHLVHKTLVGVDVSFTLTIVDESKPVESKKPAKPKPAKPNKKPAAKTTKKQTKTAKVTDYFDITNDDDDFVEPLQKSEPEVKYVVTEIRTPDEEHELSLLDVFESEDTGKENKTLNQSTSFVYKKPKMTKLPEKSNETKEPELNVEKMKKTPQKECKDDLDMSFNVFTNVSILENKELAEQAELIEYILPEEDIFVEDSPDDISNQNEMNSKDETSDQIFENDESQVTSYQSLTREDVCGEIDNKIDDALKNNIRTQLLDRYAKAAEENRMKNLRSPIVEEDSPPEPKTPEPIVVKSLLNDFKTASEVFQEDIQRIYPHIEPGNVFKPLMNSTEVSKSNRQPINMSSSISLIDTTTAGSKSRVKRKISFLNDFFANNYVKENDPITPTTVAPRNPVPDFAESFLQSSLNTTIENIQPASIQKETETVNPAKRKLDVPFNSILKRFCGETREPKNMPNQSMLWERFNSKVTQPQIIKYNELQTRIEKTPEKQIIRTNSTELLGSPKFEEMQQEIEQDPNNFTQMYLSEPIVKPQIAAVVPKARLGVRPGPYHIPARISGTYQMPRNLMNVTNPQMQMATNKLNQQNFFSKSNAQLRYLFAHTERYRSITKPIVHDTSIPRFPLKMRERVPPPTDFFAPSTSSKIVFGPPLPNGRNPGFTYEISRQPVATANVPRHFQGNAQPMVVRNPTNYPDPHEDFFYAPVGVNANGNVNSNQDFFFAPAEPNDGDDFFHPTKNPDPGFF